MDLPSVVNSTWDSGAILSKSRMGRSMTTAQLFPCFAKFLIITCSTLQSIPMVDQCKYMIAFEFPEVKRLTSFSSDDGDDPSSAPIPAIPRRLPFELSRNIGKASKSSVPVLSAQKPWFSQGFSHIGPVPLAVCSAHATRCMAPAALHFASRYPNRVVFRVARVVKTLGFCMAPSGTAPRPWKR